MLIPHRFFLRPLSRGFSAALGMALLAAACTDNPAEPTLVAGEVRTEPRPGGNSGARIRREAFVCVTRLARASDPSAWSRAEKGVRFPAAELDPQGRTIAYRYRGYTPSNRIVAAVDCVIPATEAAIERMNRKLKVSRWHRLGSEAVGSGARMSLGTASFDLGTEGSPTALAPVVGTARWCGPGYVGTYPACYPVTSGTVGGTGTEPDDGWEWWEGPDGGTEPDDGTGRDPCDRDEAGHCITREIEPDEWTRLLERIDDIKEVPDYCRGAKQALQAFADKGRASQRLRFWDGYDKPADDEQVYGQNLSDPDGRYIQYDSYWIWHMPELLAHEGIHHWLNQLAVAGTPRTLPAGMTNEQWVRSVDQNCV